MNQETTPPNRGLIRAVAVLLTIYTFIEVTDCVTLLLMHFGVIGNLYPRLTFAEFDTLLVFQPLAMFPVFLFFTMPQALVLHRRLVYVPKTRRQ